MWVNVNVFAAYIISHRDHFLQAPLAECESSCIENSPAVEMSPVKFILDKIHRTRIEGSSEDGATESQSLDPSSSTNSVRGYFQQNKCFEALIPSIFICQTQ